MAEVTDKKYTADVVLFADGYVLLIKRKWDPFADHLALPGGHVDAEDALAYPPKPSRVAASRELKEETGIELNPDALRFVGTWASADRDPRGFYSTDVYTAILPNRVATRAADDAAMAVWVPIELVSVLPLAFDHLEIIQAAVRDTLG